MVHCVPTMLILTAPLALDCQGDLAVVTIFRVYLEGD